MQPCLQNLDMSAARLNAATSTAIYRKERSAASTTDKYVATVSGLFPSPFPSQAKHRRVELKRWVFHQAWQQLSKWILKGNGSSIAAISLVQSPLPISRHGDSTQTTEAETHTESFNTALLSDKAVAHR